jgi:hypothetical protein
MMVDLTLLRRQALRIAELEAEVARLKALVCEECGGSGTVLDAPARVLDGGPYWTPCPTCARKDGPRG